MKQVITRFAPSPTGNLHIGGARTALFNFLFAKHHQGQFLLRIEDTDQERSKPEFVESILSSLRWLGIEHDGEAIYQLERIERHKQVAQELVEAGKAYLCFASQEEINQAREDAIVKGESFRFESKWRDSDPKTYPTNISPTIRIKAPKTGEIVINDLVQGEVRVGCNHLDDLILLRSDGTPTYMLAVVVDDYDMGITHIIRGDEHLNNAFRQRLIFDACGWEPPLFAHIPLIHAPDGAKLSKRHGATSADQYRKMGYLPEALCNYLLRLGWSNNDEEIISQKQAIEWFNLESVGRSPAKFDQAKLDFLNAHYIKETDNKILLKMIRDGLAKNYNITKKIENYITQAIDLVKPRAKLITELVDLCRIFCELQYTEEASNLLKGSIFKKDVIEMLFAIEDYSTESLKKDFNQLADMHKIKVGELMILARALVIGRLSSPSIIDIISILGKSEVIDRLNQNK